MNKKHRVKKTFNYNYIFLIAAVLLIAAIIYYYITYDSKVVVCPARSSITNVGPETNIKGCNCASDMKWNGYICTPLVIQQDNDEEQSACPMYQMLNTDTNKCVQTCPLGTSKLNGGGPSNVQGCNCIEKTNWYDGRCLECPPGSNHDNEGDVTSDWTCRCPLNSKWIVDKCMPCPNGTTTTNIGSVSSVEGCRCPENKLWSTRINRCVNCIGGATMEGTGQEALNFPGCYCPEGKKWQNTYKVCV